MKKKILMFNLFMLLLCPLSVNADAIDDYYNEITDDGKIYFDVIETNSENERMWLNIYATSKYSNDTFEVSYGCIDADTCDKLLILNKETGVQKGFDSEINYNNYNQKVYNLVNGFKGKFPSTVGENPEDKLLRMDDLDIINFIYNGGFNNSDNPDYDTTTVINYSSEVNKIFENTNIGTQMYPARGWDDQFSSGAMGPLLLTYDDFAYAIVEETGVKGNKVIYVPDVTENTDTAFIAAAKKRIKSYLGVDIDIKVAGNISDLNDEDWCITLEEIVNVEKTTGKYYTFTINKEEYPFFIEKSSSKMQTGYLSTKDIKNGSMIFTKSPSVPLDSKINYFEIDKDSKEYKDLLSKLNLKDGVVVDISLFSDTKGNIKKLENGVFKTYIPLTEEMKNKKLMAYFVKEDGTIEERIIKFEGDYGVFETNHFSTYTIGEYTTINNPKTGDNIINYVIIGGVSLAVIGACFILINKKKKVK